MYDFDTEYWDDYGYVNPAYKAWKQREGRPSYVRPNDETDTLGSMVVVLHDMEAPVISGTGVIQATDNWRYGNFIRIFQNELPTVGPQAIAGATYSGVTIPTWDEWSAMTTEEQNAWKNANFSPSTPTGTDKYGVPIGVFYVVKVWLGALVRGIDSETSGYKKWSHGEYQSDSDYPFYVVWRDITSNNYAISPTYDPSTGEYSTHEFRLMDFPSFVDEETGVFKAIVIQTQYVEKVQFWTGYNSSGGMKYGSSQYGNTYEPCDLVQYKIRKGAWWFREGMNHGYPINREMSVLDYEAFNPPYPPFFWTVNPNENNGYVNIRSVTDEETKMISEPVPPFFWTVNPNENHGYVGICHIPNKMMGAFANSTLQAVEVTPNLSAIGEYAFEESHISEITISDECSYYDTSFPEGCDVNTFDE